MYDCWGSIIFFYPKAQVLVDLHHLKKFDYSCVPHESDYMTHIFI